MPGTTDLRAFTTVLLPQGRHRLDRTRRWLRVVLDPATGRPALRVVVLDGRPLSSFVAQQSLATQSTEWAA